MTGDTLEMPRDAMEMPGNAIKIPGNARGHNGDAMGHNEDDRGSTVIAREYSRMIKKAIKKHSRFAKEHKCVIE